MYIWEGPKSSQDSSERYDLTFNAWEGERKCASQLGDLIGPEIFQATFSRVDLLYFSITLL